MDESGSDNLVPVATGYGLPEANVTLSFLRAYGIHAVARTWHHASLAWHMMIALGGIEISVPHSQREAAIALLADITDRNDDLARPYARQAGLNACVALVIYLLFSVPPPARGLFVKVRPLHDVQA